jgi:hypothetical protein
MEGVNSKAIAGFVLVWFCSTGVCPQGLMLARQLEPLYQPRGGEFNYDIL